MDQFRNQEVFIVTGAEDEDITELFVTDNRIDLDEHLKLKNPAIDEEVRVFHGVLTLAEYLPPSFRGRSAYIVVLHPDKLDEGCVVEANSSPEEVAREIETLIADAPPMTLGDLSIDCIYMLYGYQLELGLSINEDEIDEEYIFACEQIADESSEVEDEVIEAAQGGNNG